MIVHSVPALRTQCHGFSLTTARPHTHTHSRNIAFVLLLLLDFIYSPLTCAFLLHCSSVLRLFTKWRRMCNKNKTHMALHSRTISTQLSTSARLNNSLVYSFLLLSPNPFDSSLFFTSFLSRLLYLIEAHIFHLYSGENFSRYLHYPLPFPSPCLRREKKNCRRNSVSRNRRWVAARDDFYFGEANANWKCFPFCRTIMTWRITRNFLFRNRHPISCCSGFRLRRPFRYTSSQYASLIPILVKMSIARSGIAVTRISFLQIDISAIASYFHNTLCDCLLLALLASCN